MEIDFYKLCSSIDAMVSWMEELDVKDKIIFVMIQCATKLCKEVAKTQNMRQKLTLSETECQTNHNKFSSVSMELGNTKQKLSKLTEELVSKDKEISNLRNNISSMSRESSVEQEKINSWNAKFSEMIEESTSAQKRVAELTEELSLLREKINTSEKMISVSAENFSIVNMELSTYKEKYFKCEETLSAVQTKFDELSAKFHSTSTDLDVANARISILEVESLVKDAKIEQLRETFSESGFYSDDEILKYSICRLSDVEYHHRKKMAGRRVTVGAREGILTSVVGDVAYVTSANGYVYHAHHEEVQLQY